MTDQCTLCDLPLAETAVENDDGDQFCCRGCRDVYATLSEREEASVEDDPAALETEEFDPPADHETTFLQVDGMHCATCETFIEARAGDNDGVSGVDASYITDTVRVSHDPEETDEDSLLETLTGLGYRAFSRDDPLAEQRAQEDVFWRLVAGAVFGMFIMMPYIVLIYPMYFGGLWYPDQQAEFLGDLLAGPSATPLYYMMGIFAGAVLFYTGGPILKGAYVSLRARSPNMDLLIALAATSAWLYSTVAIFAESGLPHLYYDVTVGIILVVTAGSYYENQIKQRATDKLAGLTEAQVSEATLYDGADATTTIDVDDLTTGDRVLVREGERVPVDGTVADGEGTVDEAVVTGESRPVGKTPGDEVVGGSLLQEGSLVVAAGEGAESSIDRLTDVVWNLQSANHGIQQLADRLATVFVPLVLVLGAVVGVAHFVLGAGLSAALLVALTVLIVSCPCALGLATPLAIAASIRDGLERGIVVFDETIFERLRGVDLVVFDKTGTLTTGEMRVLDHEGPGEAFERAALLETRSSHPVATAVAERFGTAAGAANTSDATDGGEPTTDGDTADGAEPTTDGGEAVAERADDSTAGPERHVEAFESYATGVGGLVDGTEMLVGTVELFEDRGWTVDDNLRARATEIESGGDVAVVVGEDGAAVGVAAVGDQPREGWSATIDRLDERGIEVAILTGDSSDAAAEFADHPGVDQVFAGVPPEAKAETIRGYGAGKQTVMVGDGTNDAPALATADLGIALGGGTALAADAADVAITTDDLASLETVFDLAAAANGRVKQNIGWAFCYNGVAIPLAVSSLLNPLFAALAMAASSGLVVTNSARPLLGEE
jgi:Cu2+-exporting ATPase